MTTAGASALLDEFDARRRVVLAIFCSHESSEVAYDSGLRVGPGQTGGCAGSAGWPPYISRSRDYTLY
jgi:hypothetical protein